MPRTHSPRAHRSANVSLPEVFIPDKLYFRIGEVSKLTHTKPYVLRFWETEFPTLKPRKSKSGHRLYRRRDVELVLEIRRLLYGKGFTISGARKHLANNSRSEAPQQRHLYLPALDAPQLRAIRHELQAILTILSRKC
jgi:DNA-binding transcriptional MerR regulator